MRDNSENEAVDKELLEECNTVLSKEWSSEEMDYIEKALNHSRWVKISARSLTGAVVDEDNSPVPEYIYVTRYTNVTENPPIMEDCYNKILATPHAGAIFAIDEIRQSIVTFTRNSLENAITETAMSCIQNGDPDTFYVAVAIRLVASGIDARLSTFVDLKAFCEEINPMSDATL